jgi:hypothetical protein
VLGERIERNLYGLLETLIAANYNKNRQRLLEEANLSWGDSSLESVHDVRGRSAMVAVGDICDG